jgi:hypothetical protein
MPDLRHIRTFTQLVRYLEDELGWPLDGYGVDDLTFVYEAEELGLKPVDAAKVKKIRQLRPLDSKQPWGIFFIEFDRKKLPVVVLRRILSHLVVKKRASANKADRAAWSAEDLLFISAFGAEDEDGREITFAHFHQEDGDLPTLRVLGWDGGDTPLKFEHLEKTLKERLHWPDAKESLDAWRARWAGVFRHRVGHIINTSDMLAEAMAELAKRIRDAAKTLIDRETEKGPLRKLHEAFKTHLIHDLTEEGFADTYAQTITYGLLTAAISRTEMSEGKHGTALVASNVTDMVPVTNPFLKEMLQTFLQVGGRKGGIDFDELGVQDVVELLRSDETDIPAILHDFGKKTRGEDPVLHFYEHFLSAYNKQLKIQRGVFYTPQPVVSYIVRSVHELLQTEFGLKHGLADTTTWGEMIQNSKSKIQNSTLTLPPLTDEPGCTETISSDEMFVQILDPATGTATFLVEVIDVIHNHLQSLWKKSGAAAMPSIPNSKSNIQNWSDFWNAYVPKALLPRLHAYELMMAPYAIAHMKIGLKLAETGYRFETEERARIYLTNALEPWQKQLPLIGFDALAHEAAAVNEIKRHKRFTVVIGNPPYSGEGMNKGEWIRSLIETYMYVDGSHLAEKGKKNWLQDDYVKFIRYAQFALDATGVGILGFINNHSCLDNPTFRGMRASLMASFPLIHVLDLHGNTGKRERCPDDSVDENVFDIQQGVSIDFFRRTPKPEGSNTVAHANLWGLRGDSSKHTPAGKYGWLTKQSYTSTDWASLSPNVPFYLFVPQDIILRREYEEYWKLTDVMPHYGAGIITSRDHFVIDFEDAPLLKRIELFHDDSIPDDWIRTHLEVKDNSMWSMADARRDFRKHPIRKELIVDLLYRPFDTRRIYFETNVVFNMRIQVMRHMLAGRNLGLLTARSNKSPTPDHFFCSKLIAETKCGESTTQSSFFPLFLFPSGRELSLGTGQQVNLSPDFLVAAKHIISGEGESAANAEDIFHYVYAVFHSPGYRSRYAEFLKIDFPRLPLTGNLALFRELSRLGGDLVALHLLESPKLDTPITEFIGKTREVTRIGWSDDTVWLDAPAIKKGAFQAPGSIGFRGVPEAVWNFHIGGYQVCQKWLKDRKGRTLTDEDIAHYHKIVIALTETIRLMAEIDQVINAHGGWPGAFTGDAK